MIEKRIATRPLYLQVRDHLAKEIAARTRKPGVPLPNEADLARELGVSPGTLRKALETLENERLITRRQGRGTFVRDHSTTDAPLGFENLRTGANEPIPASVAFLGATSGPATAVEQQRLELPSGDLVLRTKQIRRYHDAPYIYEEASLPSLRFSGLETSALTAPHQISTLAQERGVLLGGGSETVEIAGASAAVATLLAVDRGTPLLKLDRVIYSMDECPLEWRVAYCHLRSVKYIAELKM